MNIVFYLSEPLDLFPLFDKPLPAEIVRLKTPPSFEKLNSEFHEYFPDAEFFVIDGGRKPSFYEYYQNMDILHFASGSIFTKVFLFAAFSQAAALKPFTLFIPGNAVFDSIEKLAGTVREASKNPLAASALTFYSSPDGSFSKYIEKSDPLFKQENLELAGIRSLKTAFEVRKWFEDNPGKNASDKFLGGMGIFSANTMKLAESIAGYHEDFHELMLMVRNAWDDGRSINTVLKDVLQVLDGYSFSEFILKMEDRFVCPVSISYQELAGLQTLMERQPLDEAFNLVYGNVTAENVTHSLLWNESPDALRIENTSRIMAVSKNGTTRMRPI